jgi:hypothetical protein
LDSWIDARLHSLLPKLNEEGQEALKHDEREDSKAAEPGR